MRILSMHSRNRLLIAGVIGLLIGTLATARIAIPSWSLLAQLSQFSPLARVAILIRLLSPLLSFLLAGGWAWVLLWMGEGAFSWRSGQAASGIRKRFQERMHPRSPQTFEQVEISQTASIQEERVQTYSQRTRLAVPPLFQLSEETLSQLDHLPMTPVSVVSPVAKPISDVDTEEDGVDEERDNGEIEEAAAKTTQGEQTVPSQAVDTPQELQGMEEATATSEKREETFSLRTSALVETKVPVTLTLLRQVHAFLQADDGTTIEVQLHGGENANRLIQLAHIAWQQGKHVDRDKLLTYVLSRGKRRDASTDQLGEVFDAAKRYLRQDLDKAVHDLQVTGHPISQDIDFFSNESGFYWLHSSCRVSDLEKIEEQYQIIQRARKEGLLDAKLDGTAPAWVLEACRQLIEAYPGDFLQQLTEKFPDEFGSWVREPITLYRDRYLAALLIVANHESALGRIFSDAKLSVEQNEEQRRNHTAKAAQLFYDYAMYALNSRWDLKLKFAYRAGKDGERVIRAARALRRGVVELGKLGNPDMIDQMYLTFKERMSTLSEGTWKPDKDTERDVEDAKKTTSAYRFASQIPPAQKEGNKN